MATFKCKMCGGELIVEDGVTVCECEYCGSKQTVTTTDSEKIIKLYERANRLRMASEFDKAYSVYESIIAELDSDAEAYWGMLLCKYGIEYVDDPATGNKIPTCHRSSFESIMEDSDFDLVMENADALSRSVYREQAKQIEEIRKGIIEVSGKEQPYDIFICYKETDENGDRTLDSVIAQDVYDVLVGKGYRVFFSRITLEDKLGTEYEPYIFAALNSAKVMLAFGTSYDYYNAVWVKNEWSRFLKIIAKDKNKYLIPCYKGIDAYDMPKEFAKLQAQDMGKVGAIQDLVRGIDKITGRTDSMQTATQTIIQNVAGNNMQALLKRGNLALEDGEWDKADDYFEEVLNQNAECADAYVGKLLAKLHITCKDKLGEYGKSFGDDNNYIKAVRFGDTELPELNKLSTYNGLVLCYNDSFSNNTIKLVKEFVALGNYKESKKYAELCKDIVYKEAKSTMENASDEIAIDKTIELFKVIEDYKDSRELCKQCNNESKYIKANVEIGNDTIDSLSKAIDYLKKIPDYKDASEKIVFCQLRSEKLKNQLLLLDNQRAAKYFKTKEKKALVTRVAIYLAAFLFILTIFVYVVYGQQIKNEITIKRAYKECTVIAESYGLNNISWGECYYNVYDKKERLQGTMICDNFDDLSSEQMFEMAKTIRSRLNDLHIDFDLYYYICRGDKYLINEYDVIKNDEYVY